VLDGEHPTHVPDAVIADLRQREVNGFVILPKGPATGLSARRVRIKLAIFDGMKPHERVAVLLTMLGTQRTGELPKAMIRPV
jgi:hypothetical protein